MPILTPETFTKLFSREGLRPFQPRPGAKGQEPILEVMTTADVRVFVLAIAGFNDWEVRRQAVAMVGAQCADAEVVAVRFGSEAWMRAFTEEEAEARGKRLVESYPDKEEVIIVIGQMADGPSLVARARLHRRPNGTVAYLGPWDVDGTRMTASPLLDAFWEGYHAAKESPA